MDDESITFLYVTSISPYEARMNINFQSITGQKTREDIILSGREAEERIVSGPSKSTNLSKTGYALDIDASGFTDNAYAGHSRSVEDIMGMAQNTDVQNRHNFMALLSNTMSEEDYEKALKDGFDIKDINSAETVNIVDRIKSVLLEAGVEVAGYNDDLSYEKLKKITGSDAFAKALQQSFHENDIPVTAENVKASKTAIEQVADITELDDSAVKYMVLNNMKPTIENIYFASHSTNGLNVMGRGFYAQEAGGYYAQTADSFDWEQLEPQIDKVIEEAGLDPKNETVKENARWMVTQGVPLTAGNLEAVNTIKEVELPLTLEQGTRATAAAIADGKRAIDGNLSDPTSNLTKAADLVSQVKEISDEDIKSTIISGKELNIRNLSNAVQTQTSEVLPENESRLVLARIQMEEVRLRMTTEANKQLLDRGFSIDTAPIEDLIAKLRSTLGQMGNETAGEAIDEITDVKSAGTGYMMRMTMTRVSFIAQGPADIVGEMADDFESASLFKISQRSEALTEKFAKAGEGYERLMTAPRADLGDSIKKAFRNVDDILKDLDKELTDENRRVIRILGYNRMDINEENFEKVRGWDQKLQAVVSRIKPGAVLDLIRDGQNPLSMTIEELSGSLDRHSSSSDGQRGKSEEKYAKFLYKLEKKNGITDKERESYIGIYRLFHTLKTTDYQAIGSLLKTGRDMTIGNLLEATRNQKASRAGMDVKVDDEFGGLESKASTVRIDEQISSAFRYYSAKAEIVYENLEPEKLMQAAPSNDTLLPKLADDLKAAETDESLEREYVKEQVTRIRQTAQLKAAEPALDELKAVQIETTFNNMEAMIGVRRDRRNGGLWDKTGDLKETALLTEKLDEDDYQENYLKILGDISDKLSEELMTDDDNYIDVRAISLLQRQITVMSKSAESDSYEVPVEIEGQTVSMHVTLKSEKNANSRMDASVQTDMYGLIQVSLYKEEGMIRGMLTTTNSSNQEESEYLEDVRTRLCEKLSEKIEGVLVDTKNIAILYHAQSGPVSSGAASSGAREGNEITQTDTKTLLTMAKAFIEAL